MDLEELAFLLTKAETIIGVEGLCVRFQADGSGCVSTFDDVDVFRFDNDTAAKNLQAFEDWIRDPILLKYDDEGTLIG